MKVKLEPMDEEDAIMPAATSSSSSSSSSSTIPIIPPAAAAPRVYVRLNRESSKIIVPPNCLAKDAEWRENNQPRHRHYQYPKVSITAPHMVFPSLFNCI